LKHWAARATRSTALGLLAEVFARAANTIFFVLLTWLLGDIAASAYALGFTFTTFFIPIALGGLDQLLAREVARDSEHSTLILGNFLLARLVSSALCYVALALWVLGPYGFTPAVNQVILVLGVTIITDNLVNIFQSYLIARDRVGTITILGAVTGGLKLALGSLILLSGGDALASAWIVLITSIVSCLCYLWLIQKSFGWPRCSLDRAFWRVNARAELPLLLIALMSTVEGSFDVLLLSRSGNAVVVGVYAAATGILNVLLMLPQTYRQIILPIMTTWYYTLRERAFTIYVQSGRVLLIMSLFISASLTLVADQVLPILYHNEFLPAISVIQILVWSFVFSSITVPNGRLMLTAGRQVASVPIQVGSVVLNIALNVALQPTLGPQGAALARVASTALFFICSFVYVQRNIYTADVWSVAAAPIGAVLCMIAVTLGLRWLNAHWLPALASGWVAYVIALVAFRAISPAELRSLIALGLRRDAQTIVKGPS
jgi:O-antigen/teichoic acid export membrane protein